MNTIKRGQIVTYKGAGKVSRLEGLSGKIITGTVIAVDGDYTKVRPNHRQLKTAPMHGVDAIVAREQILSVIDKTAVKVKNSPK